MCWTPLCAKQCEIPPLYGICECSIQKHLVTFLIFFIYKFVLFDIFCYLCVYNGVVRSFAPTFSLTGEYVFGLMCSDLLLGKNK